MTPWSESQYAARFAAGGVELKPEELSGSPEERRLRAELQRRFASDGEDWETDEMDTLVALVEWLALHRLGSAAEAPRIQGWKRLYVLSFAGARPFVKVGRTGDFAIRLRTHRTRAERDGNVLFDAWTSELVADAHPWEQGVLRELRRRHPGVSRGESFYALDYEEAIEVVHQQRIRITPCSVGLSLPRWQPA
ncbi:GIY-YIG nuclease family protein [Streptomyces sp. CB01881]|uniref:GIY-YIG nuclease family protein n=1 Tax=Streptomyces sp. CB01881 TaxID=2078691 RepID=UPI000CDBD11A|nr:GIY-YIG nuclease family protein [Streptomyces sp. CB01881]AUY49243.1 hypothetical protein C2142_10140 [Streptomyces sp. CB01881]TYC72635.1 GIY-YIG nuclease family protein [Streptomyces sp. CB01881]